MKQKLYSLVLSICMLTSLLVVAPITASAISIGDYSYTIMDGKATLTGCSSTVSGTITIPSCIGCYPITAIGSSAFMNCIKLNKVIIPDSITDIGEEAFANCSYLRSVIIGNSVTTIGDSAFYSCKSLTNITIPDSATTIGNSAFVNCENLTNITIPDSVAIIGNQAFYSCDNLTNITIGNSVTIIGDSAFSGCKSLTNITIPDSVTIIGDSAFSSCNNLIDVNIGNRVDIIGSAAFCNCENLTNITIPDSVTIIGNAAFYECSKLADITIGNQIATIGNNVFYNCSRLKNIYYTETKDKWDLIEIGSGNEYLTRAIIHYNHILLPTVTVKKVVADKIEKVQITTANIPAGSEIILACYQGNILSYVEPVTVLEGQSDYYFLPDTSYTSAKILVIDNFEKLSPLIEATPVE